MWQAPSRAAPIAGCPVPPTCNTFCCDPTCRVFGIGDQIGLVASLKGGAFGNVRSTRKLNSDGYECRVVTTGATGLPVDDERTGPQRFRHHPASGSDPR
jgi:hypothetical protein